MTEFTIETVDWDDPRARAVRAAMDLEINARYAGRDFDPDKVAKALEVRQDDIACTLIAVTGGGTPVGHAALRRLGDQWEVKRVMVLEAARGHGLARTLMAGIEAAAAKAGAHRVILQTGDRQPEGVALYRSIGYTDIPIYEPYVDAIPFSICLAKELTRPQPET